MSRRPKAEPTPKLERAAPPAAAKEEQLSTIEFVLPKTTAEFERQLASMKHIPPAHAPPAARMRIPATGRLPGPAPSFSLPPIVLTASTSTTKHQFTSSYDKWADTDFYSDFKFTFVPLPVPRDVLPRKCRVKLPCALL